MAWKLNPFTGKFDYYAQGDYQLFADANVTTWAITSGLMKAAPVIPPAPEVAGQVFQDDGDQVFYDDDGQVMQDA
jgi:hypothetical protein